MTSLLALDPGARTGWAFFRRWPHEGWVLEGAGVVTPAESLGVSHPDFVVIENPQIYPNSKARPADILTLARLVGRYEERFRKTKVLLVLPRQWKGTIDGDVMIARIEAALTPDEAAVCAAYQGGYGHNMIDAIGLAKWAVRMLPELKVRAPSPAPSPQ